MAHHLTPFQPGHAKVGGRKKGARNRLSAEFIAAMADAFEEHGATAIEIVIKESPKDFLKVIAAILPKEFEINDSRLKDIPDDQLDAFIEFAKRHLGITGEPDGGKNPALN